jgi:hypothetical protein
MSHRWPLSEYPALNPQDFPDQQSFASLRRPADEIRSSAKDGQDVLVHWCTVPTRDGSEIDTLRYECIFGSQDGERPLVMVFHGGGNAHAPQRLACKDRPSNARCEQRLDSWRLHSRGQVLQGSCDKNWGPCGERCLSTVRSHAVYNRQSSSAIMTVSTGVLSTNSQPH